MTIGYIVQTAMVRQPLCGHTAAKRYNILGPLGCSRQEIVLNSRKRRSFRELPQPCESYLADELPRVAGLPHRAGLSQRVDAVRLA